MTKNPYTIYAVAFHHDIIDEGDESYHHICEYFSDKNDAEEYKVARNLELPHRGEGYESYQIEEIKVHQSGTRTKSEVKVKIELIPPQIDSYAPTKPAKFCPF